MSRENVMLFAPSHKSQNESFLVSQKLKVFIRLPRLPCCPFKGTIAWDDFKEQPHPSQEEDLGFWTCFFGARNRQERHTFTFLCSYYHKLLF
jgi:hypothetical protein